MLKLSSIRRISCKVRAVAASAQQNRQCTRLSAALGFNEGKGAMDMLFKS